MKIKENKRTSMKSNENQWQSINFNANNNENKHKIQKTQNKHIKQNRNTIRTHTQQPIYNKTKYNTITTI